MNNALTSQKYEKYLLENDNEYLKLSSSVRVLLTTIYFISLLFSY